MVRSRDMRWRGKRRRSLVVRMEQICCAQSRIQRMPEAVKRPIIPPLFQLISEPPKEMAITRVLRAVVQRVKPSMSRRRRRVWMVRLDGLGIDGRRKK